MTGGMLHQLMDPRGEYLENYRCVDRCQKLNTSAKVAHVTKLSDALIIQKKRKREKHDNLDDSEKEHLKKEDNKRKKEKQDNLDDNEKEQLRKFEKKGKKVMHDNLDGKKII